MLYAMGKAWKRLRYHKRILSAVLFAHSMFDFDFQFLAVGLLLVLLMAEGEEAQADVCVRGSRGRGNKDREKQNGRGWKGKKASAKRQTHKKNPVVFWSRIVALALAALCLWIGTADFLAYIKKPEAAVRVYPAHTRSLMVLLTQAETPEEMERLAGRILRINRYVSLACDAKANVAYTRGDAQEMVVWKRRAIALARYNRKEYEDYLERLVTFIRLYQEAGMQQSAAFCRERVLEIPEMLREVEENSSPLAWMIYEKPELELTERIK